jgi:hypothetical protein
MFFCRKDLCYELFHFGVALCAPRLPKPVSDSVFYFADQNRYVRLILKSTAAAAALIAAAVPA